MPVAGFGFAERGKPPTSDEVAAALGEYYNFVIDAFGCDRCMWESNFPVVRFGIGSKAGSLWPCLNPGAGRLFVCPLASYPATLTYPATLITPMPHTHQDKASYSCTVLWNAFKKISAGRGCTEDEMAALFSGTATRVYQLGETEAATTTLPPLR